MGAQGSKPGENRPKEESKVPDYYEILQVEDSATADEIKVSQGFAPKFLTATEPDCKVESIP